MSSKVLAPRWFCLSLAVLAMAAGCAWSQGDVVREMVVRGNVNIEASKILAMVTHIKVGEPYSQDALQQDLNAIRDMGFFEGLPDGVVEPIEGGVRVVIEVVEYPKVQAVEFVGNTVVKEDELKGEQGIILQPGDVFNRFTLRRGLENVDALYREKGYLVDIPDVEAPVTGQQWNGVLRVHLTEVTVESVELVGLVKTRRKVVMREVRTAKGDLYNLFAVREDQRRLLNKGFFDEQQGVTLSVKAGTEPGKVVVILEFKEKPTGLFTAGVGYSSRNKLVGYTEVSELNFRGLGQQASLKWEFGGISSYEVGFTEPWINDKHWGITVNAYNKLLNRYIASEFAAAGVSSTRNEKRAGADVTLAVPMDKTETTWLWATLRREDVSGRFEGEGLNIIEPFYTQGRVASIAVKGVYDTRDYYNYPTQGWRNSLTIETAGSVLGSERSFTKYSVDVRKYLDLGKGQVGAARLMLGSASGDVPLFETFVIGGAETLRGFAEDRFWGRRMLLLNLEYRIPLDSPTRRALIGVVFVDWGDAWGGIWSTPDQSVVYPAEHQAFAPHPGYGFGLRVATPVGPIRMDLGFSREGQEPHISIGQMF